MRRNKRSDTIAFSDNRNDKWNKAMKKEIPRLRLLIPELLRVLVSLASSSESNVFQISSSSLGSVISESLLLLKLCNGRSEVVDVLPEIPC